MKDLVEKLGPSLIPLKIGTTTEVEVVSVTRNRIIVNVKDFFMGMIPEKEFSVETMELKPGDKILAYLIDLENQDGYAVFSLKRADKERVWQTLRQKLDSKEAVKVKAIDANRGGLVVQYGNIEGFVPISQLSTHYYSFSSKSDTTQMISELRKLIDKILEVKIISIDQTDNKLIFSEKEVSQANQKEKIKELFKVGSRVKGKISGIVQFGLFINLGEAEGLVHISEISWERVSDLNKMFKVGQEIEVEVISIENGKISLSIKRLTSDPWLKSVEKYKIGQELEGEITRITPFGAFVKLDEEISGLVHISELALQAKDKKVAKLEDVLTIGNKYKFKILSIEPEAHKVGLTLSSDKKEDDMGLVEEKEKKTGTKRSK